MKTILFSFFFSVLSFSQSLNYDYSVTFGNHIIAINEINYEFQEGDIIGCFFLNSDGDFQCCGSTVYNNEEIIYISAWPDDFLTENQEGFYEGDQVIMGFYLCDNNDYISIEYDLSDPYFSIIHPEIFYSSNGITQMSVELLFSPNCDSSIEAQNNQKKQIRIMNYLGQNLNKITSNDPFFIFYNDGTVEKKLITR